MANKRNPTSNSILQAFLDVSDAGYSTMTVGQFISKLSSDKKLAADMQAKWNGHTYPDRTIEWTQLTRTQQLMTLSDAALKVLTFLGMYAAQSTLVQVSQKDLATFTGIKRTVLRESLKELESCGCIRVDTPAKRHAAPIYSVNPAIISTGKRSKGKMHDFTNAIDCTADYILKRNLPILVDKKTVYEEMPDGSKIMYNSLQPMLPGSKEEDAPRKPRRAAKKAPAADEQLPGQMTFNDFPEILPGDVKELPF